MSEKSQFNLCSYELWFLHFFSDIHYICTQVYTNKFKILPNYCISAYELYFLQDHGLRRNCLSLFKNNIPNRDPILIIDEIFRLRDFDREISMERTNSDNLKDATNSTPFVSSVLAVRYHGSLL